MNINKEEKEFFELLPFIILFWIDIHFHVNLLGILSVFVKNDQNEMLKDTYLTQYYFVLLLIFFLSFSILVVISNYYEEVLYNEKICDLFSNSFSKLINFSIQEFPKYFMLLVMFCNLSEQEYVWHQLFVSPNFLEPFTLLVYWILLLRLTMIIKELHNYIENVLEKAYSEKLKIKYSNVTKGRTDYDFKALKGSQYSVCMD